MSANLPLFAYNKYNDYTLPQAGNRRHAQTTDKNTYQDDSSIFAKFQYSSNDNISTNAVDLLNNSIAALIKKYPNLRDNIEGLGGAFFNANKDLSILNSYGLPLDTKMIFAQDNIAGTYNYETHQLIFDAGKPGEAFKNFTHEFGHAIDYIDLNANGTSADDVSYNQYGSFSSSSEFITALYSDLKHMESLNIEAEYPQLVHSLSYSFGEVIDGNRFTYRNARETFALLASHIMSGEDQTSKIAEVLPNTYALAKRKVETS